MEECAKDDPKCTQRKDALVTDCASDDTTCAKAKE